MTKQTVTQVDVNIDKHKKIIWVVIGNTKPALDLGWTEDEIAKFVQMCVNDHTNKEGIDIQQYEKVLVGRK